VSRDSFWPLLTLLTLLPGGMVEEGSSSENLHAAIPQLVFSNTNTGEVQRNPDMETWFVTDHPVLLMRVETYHLPDATSSDVSTISIRNADGTSIGEWSATGVALQEGQPASIRSINPGVVIPPGEYLVEDSSRDTWSWNEQSGGGMAQAWGIAQNDADQQQPPAEGMQRLILNGLQLDVQLAWKPVEVPASVIHHLEMGVAGDQSAKIEVLRRRGFEELLACVTAERGAELTGLSEQTVGSRTATEYQFSDPEKGTQGILLALSHPLSDGTYAAVVCEAPADSWIQIAELLEPMRSQIRVAPQIGKDATPVLTGSEPETIMESPMPEPELSWSPPPLTWNGPERWYTQPAGYFRIRLPDDWVVEERVLNLAADPDFDSLKDPTKQFVLICSRGGQSCSSADRMLMRYAGLKLAVEHCERSEVSFLTLGEAPAVRLRYMTSQDRPKAVSHLGFVYQNLFFVINTVAPPEAGLSELSPNLQELLETLQFLPDAMPESFYGPLGAELLDYKSLSGLTEDFGITVYEHGAVVHDMVQHLDTAFPTGNTKYPVMAGCQTFLNSDPAKREQMGDPISGEIIIADYRLCLQLFEGGFLIQDPLQKQVLQGIHVRRNR
jgi:hypothetical protein